MTAHTDQVLLEALALAPEERSLVVLSLLDSLQGDGTPEDEIAKKWLLEARKRSDDIKSGRSEAVPVEAFRSWFNAL